MLPFLKANQDLLKRLLLIGVSIGLFTLSMPGNLYPLLTWVVVTPIAFALKEAKPSMAALLFYIAALGCILMVMSWFIAAIVNFTNLNAYLAFLVLIIFAMLLALPYAVIGWLIAYKRWLDSARGLIYASACVVVLVTFYPSPLPGTYAHSLYSEPYFVQVVDLGGIPLLLFVVIFINLHLYRLINSLPLDRRAATGSGITTVLTISVVLGYGQWRIETLSDHLSNAKHYEIGIIQPKLLREDSLDRLYRMTEELVTEHPTLDLVVWPEFPTAFSFSDNPQDKQKLRRLILKTRKPMVVVSGYSYDTPKHAISETSQYYNLTHLVDDKGRLKQTYKKQTLVPFFEYIPYEDQLPFLRELFPNTHRYIPGGKNTVFEFGDLKLIPLICYETVFPGITQDFVDAGGNIIINLTNDIWLGNSKGSNYHFAMGMFRAIEHRVPWVRATNSGISGYVPASGIINSESLTPVQTLASKVYKVKVPQNRSVYSRFGDWFLYVMTILLAFGICQKRKATPN